ncbi:MAG: hypothetical protein WCI02_04235 [Planctomycetota bacterium]
MNNLTNTNAASPRSMGGRDHKWPQCLALLFVLLLPNAALSQSLVHPFQTASAISLSSQLRSPFAKKIDRMPLRELLPLWSAEYGVPIWLDRRIANDMEVTFEPTDGATWMDALRSIADGIGAEVACIDRVVMLVPHREAIAIESSYWRIVTSHPNAAWIRPEKLAAEWDEGELVAKIWNRWSKKSNLPLLQENFDSQWVMDLDRWHHFRFENTSSLAVAVSLLSGFGWGLSSEGKQLQVVPLSQIDAGDVSWEYRDEIQKLGKEAWGNWKKRWSSATVSQVSRNGKTMWKVTAPATAHRELVVPLAPLPNKPKSAVGSDKRYTGRYRGQLQRILDGFAQQSGLRLECPVLPSHLAGLEIDLQFENVSAEEIVAKLAAASNLTMSLSEGVLHVEIK